MKIRTWYDGLEDRMPKKYHAPFRIWRVLQTLNKLDSSKCGHFQRREIEARLAEILNISLKSARRHLVAGTRVFFVFKDDSVFLIGFRRVYARFGATPSTRSPVGIGVEHITGNLKRFRRIIASLKVAKLHGFRGEAKMYNRYFLAEKLGVSLSTLRLMIKEGYLETVPVVKILRAVPPPTRFGKNFFILPLIEVDHEKGERVWDLNDGSKVIVRQMPNFYRSRFSLATLPELSHRPGAPKGALEFGYDVGNSSVYTAKMDQEWETVNSLTLSVPPAGWAAGQGAVA